jgi:hypothetical protein
MTIWLVGIGALLLGTLLGFAMGRQGVSFENAGLKIHANSAKELLTMMQAMQQIGASALQAQVLADSVRSQSAQAQPRAM